MAPRAAYVWGGECVDAVVEHDGLHLLAQHPRAKVLAPQQRAGTGLHKSNTTIMETQYTCRDVGGGEAVAVDVPILASWGRCS